MANKNSKAHPFNQFRVIAGDYKGRVFKFPDVSDLRPTPDRVRETVFNWLQFSIAGSRCLDLFCGSGALSLEAASRGASSIVCIDQSTSASNSLKSHIQTLKLDSMEVINSEAIKWLESKNKIDAFQIIFLDPPYSLTLLPQLIKKIEQQALLSTGGYVYLENNEPLEQLNLPNSWSLIKSKKAGQVYFGLCQKS